MSYQSKGLQISLLIHAAIFSLITCTNISESRSNLPVVIDFSIIKELEEENTKAPEPLPEPPPQMKEEKIEKKPAVREISAPPQTKIKPVQKKEKGLPVRAEKSRKHKEKAKELVPAEKKEAPPVEKQVKEEIPPVAQVSENVSEQNAPSVPDAVPSPPSDTENTSSAPISQSPALSDAAAGGGAGNASSDSQGGSSGGMLASKSGSGGTGYSKSGSGGYGTGGGLRYRHKEMPVYPTLARRLGKEGKVLLRLTIDENGSPVNVEVVEDSGYGFASAAIAAVKKSTFIPPTLNGRPVSAKALLPVIFTLR